MARNIAIIGLGYSGLHTALAFGKHQQIIGFDIDRIRIEELSNGIDRHGDFSQEAINKSKIKFSFDANQLKDCNFYIVIVPTPVSEDKVPNFDYLENASMLIGKRLKPGDIVVYESTVYPGATEEICIPILEKISYLKFGKDFNVGYSPERINPGDSIHRFDNTVKIISANDKDTLKILTEEYSKVTDKVMHVSNIRTAEAVKVVENIQRDVNIALINELARIFHLFDIDTEEVVKAATTKWNFISFQPGFVGGHCVGVDPYYLINKVHTLGFTTNLISTARKVNETMSQFISDAIIKYLVKNDLITTKTKIAILGVTYKENYDDIRNSKVFDMATYLKQYGIEVFFVDPIAKKIAY
jgi:UDP-N-acetyl-D-galactosamine dehydrogenase